jgi:Mce-associated membrane protein
MEGDAGASQLNPAAGGLERSDPGDVTGGQERSDPGDVTAGQEIEALNDTEAPDDSVAEELTEQSEDAEPADSGEPDAVTRRPERLGRGWFVAICALLLLLTAGVGVGGYLALRSHHQTEAIARDDALALERAKECVAATQAPDTAAMAASQTKILECSTGDFAVQANLFAGMLVDAYQVASVNVKVSDLRAAVERHNPDDSVDVLVAVRVKVTNSQAADQEQGYRLRVQMAPADGTYKVAKLDQVTS